MKKLIGKTITNITKAQILSFDKDNIECYRDVYKVECSDGTTIYLDIEVGSEYSFDASVGETTLKNIEEDFEAGVEASDDYEEDEDSEKELTWEPL